MLEEMQQDDLSKINQERVNSPIEITENIDKQKTHSILNEFFEYTCHLECNERSLMEEAITKMRVQGISPYRSK